jgi:23S rRNA (uracil1939-C5)-methyltransferase
MAAAHAALLAGCPHYLDCGGCGDLAAKDDLLPEALRAAGFADADVGEMLVCPPGARRRMDFALRRTADGVALGLHRRRSHDIVDLHQCAVLLPELVALFDPLRTVLNRLNLLGSTGAAIANRLDDGVDLLLRSDRAASRHDRTLLAEFARDHGLLRISHAIGAGTPETIAGLRPAVARFADVPVLVPPGAFLQATAEGEAAIVAAVLAGLPEKLGRRDRIAELYAGCGTLSFALAQHARVDAYEGDLSAFAALDQAVRASGVVGRLTVAQRDLVRQPLIARDLAPYVAVVLDPPAAGAALQMPYIVQAGVPRVIYVSCDPRSLGRDAAFLHSAGYRLIAATAVDQFIGTERVESICVFDRKKARVRIL